jgi:hypothetical protein
MSRRKPVAFDLDSVTRKSDTDAGNGPAAGANGGSDGTSPADTGNGTATVEPAAVAASDGDFTERRRPGRPRGSTNKAKPVPANISGIEKTLYGIHQMLGAIIAPELAIGEDDAKELASSIHAVNRHYNVRMFDEKTQDWLNLIMVAGAMYGGRIVAIRDRKRAARNTRPVMPRAQSENPVPGNAAPPPFAAAPVVERPLEKNLRVGEIPGLGAIEFPPDHPLARRH